MKKKYRVILPIEVGDKVYEFGQVVELDSDTAKDYAHALIAAEEVEDSDGRNS